MKASMRCSVCVAVLAAVFGVATVVPLAAQGDVSLTGGSGVYASDEFCLDSSTFFSVFELSGSGELFGGSVAYSNGAWPWTPPPPGGESESDTTAAPRKFAVLSRPTSLSGGEHHDAFLTHGRAIRLMAEAFPIAVLSRLVGERVGILREFNRYVRPSLGVGVYVSGDGTTAPASSGRNLPTFGLEGSTAPMLSYGARAYLPGRDKRIRLTAHYRGNTMFVREVAYRTPKDRKSVV